MQPWQKRVRMKKLVGPFCVMLTILRENVKCAFGVLFTGEDKPGRWTVYVDPNPRRAARGVKVSNTRPISDVQVVLCA